MSHFKFRSSGLFYFQLHSFSTVLSSTTKDCYKNYNIYQEKTLISFRGIVSYLFILSEFLSITVASCNFSVNIFLSKSFSKSNKYRIFKSWACLFFVVWFFISHVNRGRTWRRNILFTWGEISLRTRRWFTTDGPKICGFTLTVLFCFLSTTRIIFLRLRFIVCSRLSPPSKRWDLWERSRRSGRGMRIFGQGQLNQGPIKAKRLIDN